MAAHPDYLTSTLDDGSAPPARWYTHERLLAEMEEGQLRRVLVGWDVDDGGTVAVVDAGDEVEVTGRIVPFEVDTPKGRITMQVPERIIHPQVRTLTSFDLEYLLEQMPEARDEDERTEPARIVAAGMAFWLAENDPFQAEQVPA